MSSIRSKGSFLLHICISIIPLILTLWLRTTVEKLFLYAITVSVWGILLFRVWRYHPSTDENLALVRNFQIMVTFGFSAVLSLYILVSSTIVFQEVLPILFWGLFCIVIISFLGISVMIWRQRLLEKADQSTIH